MRRLAEGVQDSFARPCSSKASASTANGKEWFDVAEYFISEGWVKVPSGKTPDCKGQPLPIKLKGTAEAFYR